MLTNEELKPYTNCALNLLIQILNRITIEVVEEPNRKSEYYDEMAMTACTIADYINHIENKENLIGKEIETGEENF